MVSLSRSFSVSTHRVRGRRLVWRSRTADSGRPGSRCRTSRGNRWGCRFGSERTGTGRRSADGHTQSKIYLEDRDHTALSTCVLFNVCVCVSLVCVWAHLKRWFWDTPAGRRLHWRRSQCGHELLSVQRLRTESTACNTATLTWGHEGLLLFNKYFLSS